MYTYAVVIHLRTISISCPFGGVGPSIDLAHNGLFGVSFESAFQGLSVACFELTNPCRTRQFGRETDGCGEGGERFMQCFIL